jgi:hypothetical protein
MPLGEPCGKDLGTRAAIFFVLPRNLLGTLLFCGGTVGKVSYKCRGAPEPSEIIIDWH